MYAHIGSSFIWALCFALISNQNYAQFVFDYLFTKAVIQSHLKPVQCGFPRKTSDPQIDLWAAVLLGQLHTGLGASLEVSLSFGCGIPDLERR